MHAARFNCASDDGATHSPPRARAADLTGSTMDLDEYRLRESLTIDASPEEIYDLLADVSAMGRWSPVCTGGRYDADDDTWFTGDNAIGDFAWHTRCHVVAADRGHEFAFVNHGIDGQHGLVRWGFTLRPTDSGATEVTQTWEVLPSYADGFAAEGDAAGDLAQRLDGMKGMAATGMPETLTKLKSEAERTSAS
jgi:uncharacterized protein YndB with AHSA1/START domain